jgi:molecular chaperone GrpE
MTENKENENFQDDLETVSEDIFEETELEDLEENSKDAIKQLKVKLKECEREKLEHLENLHRAKAEFLNAKKRIDEEKIADREKAVAGHIEKLLPLCDSFAMAMSDKEAWDNAPATWKKGIDGIVNQLQSLLKSYGVTQMSPLGEAFDPEKHEALQNSEVAIEDEHDTVVGVIQNGFTRTVHDKTSVIRPARVAVGTFKAH